MKYILYSLFAITVISMFTACDKNITSYNTNAKLPSNVPSASLFTAGEKKIVDIYTSTSVSSSPFRVLSQEWTENTYVYEAQYNFTAYNANAGWWNGIYATQATANVNQPNPGALSNLQAARNKFYSDFAVAAEARNATIITDLLQVYAYNLLICTYGNVPYTQALKDSVPFPKYDDARTVYNDLLNRIDTCIAAMNLSANSLGKADLIYNGNMAQWKKFAATLKLKMAMMLADVDMTTASKKVLEAINTGVFTSNSDNASMPYDNSSTSSSNPIWQALISSGRHDFSPSNLLVTTLLNWNDPRLTLYIAKNSSGTYTGGIPGQVNSYGKLSPLSDQLLGQKYPGIILDYTQTEFLLAEAVERGIAVGGTAASHYNNAVTASIQFFGGSPTDAATYLAQPAIAYATASGSWQQKLGYQKWLANFNMNWDSWTDIRRLGYPDLNTISPPVGAKGNLPLRLTYPSNESGSNSVNWAAAVAALPGGQDVVSAKLFWMK